MFRKALRYVGLLGMAALLSAHVYAIGLGEIQLKSALNDPLNAEIPLFQVKGLGENDILVGIAPKDDFEAAGIDRLFFLSSLKFSLDLNNPKGPLVHITTDAPVREPYLNFLLEVQWPSGRLLREYTLLMDLPASGNASMARVIKGTEVPAASSAKDSGKTTSATIDVKELDSELASAESTPAAVAPAPAASPEPASQPLAPEAAPSKNSRTISRSKPKEVAVTNTTRAPVAKRKKAGTVKQHEQANQASEGSTKSVEESASPAGQNEGHTVVPVYEPAPADGNYSVKAGDNLWSIAMKYRKADEGSTVQQAMLAMQRMNPDAFANGNINRLKKGKVLRMPTHDDLANITSREAIDEVRKQNVAWSGSVSGKRAALTAAPEQIDATHQNAAEAPVVESQEGRLKLSVPGSAKGSVSGKASGAKAGAVAALQNELSTTMEELDRHKHEKANVSGQLSALDEQTKTMQQMLDVHNAELTALQESMASKAAQKKAAEAAAAPQPPVETAPAQTPPAQENAATTAAPAVEQAPAKTEPMPAATPAAPVKSAPVEGSSNMAWIAGGLLTLVLLVVIITKLRSRESEVDLASQIEEAVKTVPVAEAPVPAPKAPPVVAEVPAPKAPPVVPVAETPAPAPKAPIVAVEVPAPKVAPPVVAPASVKVEERSSVAESAPLAKVAEPTALSVSQPPPAPVVEAKPQTANPVDEADIYLSFGSYDKAENLLKGAISAELGRADLRLKLLEVYSATENLRAFDEQLTLLSVLHDASVITRANEMRSRMAKAAAPIPATKAPEPQESDLHFDLDVAEDLSVDLDTNFRLDSDITAKNSVVKPNKIDLDLESIDQGAPKGGFSEAPTVQQRALDISKLKTAESPAIQVGGARTEIRDSFDASQINQVAAVKPEPVKPPVAKLDLDLDLELADEATKNDPTVRSPKVDISDTPTLQQRALDISKLKTAESPAVQSSEGRTEVRDSLALDKAKLETSTAVTGSNDVVSLEEDLDFSVDADEVATKLDLAKAYIDMGDKEGAKDILQEVMEEGQAAQKQEAKKLLDSIG
jgi:pilus assembly protein FimV